MDHRKQSKDSPSYSDLFNLETLMSFQLPEPHDIFDYYENSSQDESRGSRGGAVANKGNGLMSERELSSLKKRRRSQNGDYEDEDSYYNRNITEERYRSMLGDHIQKYKRRLKDSSASPAPPRMGVPAPKSNVGLKARKLKNDQRGGFLESETTPEWHNYANHPKPGNYHEADFTPQNGTDRATYEPPYLDIGDGITYRIPPTYDKLAASLNLPSFSDIRVDEIYLEGTLDLGSLAEMMATDKRFGPTNRAGMGEPHPQYDSLHSKLKSLAASNSAQNFSLKVSDVGLHSSIPDGAAGNIKRSILSEGGVLQVYYVKVLEKGDTYEIIERSLPKKQKVKKDPSVIEREEMEKIGKVWVNIVRRDMPKHHRNFTAFIGSN